MSSTHDIADARRNVGSGWGAIHPRRWDTLVDAANPNEDSFFDMGCSNGSYVEQLRSCGFTAWGADLLSHDNWVHPYFVRSDATAIPIRSEAVSVAFGFEVMEHLPDPSKFLAELRRVATRRIVVSVPNCDVPDALRQAGVTFHHWVDPTHVNFFTKESLAACIEDAGLRLGAIDTFNPIRPEFLALRGIGLSRRLSDRTARVLEKIPRRCSFDMGLIATARV